MLTRRELERAVMWLQLNKDYDTVMFVQKSTNIGITTWARFFNRKDPSRYEEVEVTEYED